MSPHSERENIMAAASSTPAAKTIVKPTVVKKTTPPVELMVPATISPCPAEYVPKTPIWVLCILGIALLVIMIGGVMFFAGLKTPSTLDQMDHTSVVLDKAKQLADKSLSLKGVGASEVCSSAACRQAEVDAAIAKSKRASDEAELLRLSLENANRQKELLAKK